MPVMPITGPATRTPTLSLSRPDATAITRPSANRPNPHHRIWRTSLDGPAIGGATGGGGRLFGGDGGVSLMAESYAARRGAATILRLFSAPADRLAGP